MASSDTLLIWHARDAQLYTHPTYSPSNVVRNLHPLIEFTDSRAVFGHNVAFFEGIMPRHYSGGPLILRLMWIAKVETAGNVYWGVHFERQDPSKDADDNNTYGGVGWLAPCGWLVYTDVYFAMATLPAGLSPGEHLRLTLVRNRQHELDTMASPAQVLSVTVREPNAAVELESQFSAQFPIDPIRVSALRPVPLLPQDAG
jgi:hypothetical protein